MPTLLPTRPLAMIIPSNVNISKMIASSSGLRLMHQNQDQSRGLPMLAPLVLTNYPLMHLSKYCPTSSHTGKGRGFDTAKINTPNDGLNMYYL